MLIKCSDLNNYICKHNNGSSCKKLFYEYLASCFLSIWRINTPDIAFVRIDKSHIKECSNFGLNYTFFNNTCFGSLEITNSKELDDVFRVFKNKSKIKRNIKNHDFLKIALFDLWVANNDRLANNPNLIILPYENNWKLFAIDHEKIFDGNTGYPLEQQTCDETILAHEFFNFLYNRKKNIHEIIDMMNIKFDKFVIGCKDELINILDNTPKDWNINLKEAEKYIKENIFSDNWLNNTKKNFGLYFVKYLNRK